MQQSRDHFSLAIAEGALAMGFENLGNRAAGRSLDFGIGVAKGRIELRCQPPSDGALAGAHHAHKDDRVVQPLHAFA